MFIARFAQSDVVKYGIVDGNTVLGGNHAAARGIINILPGIVFFGHGGEAVLVTVGIRGDAFKRYLLNQVAIGIERVGGVADTRVLIEIVRRVVGGDAVLDGADAAAEFSSAKHRVMTSA